MKIYDDGIRSALDSELAHISMNEAQKQAILRQCEQVPRLQRLSRPVRGVLSIAATFVLSIALCGGVLAASPELRDRLYMLSATTLQQLQPVNQISEKEGIRMEVLAAVNDGSAAVVFLSLQDTQNLGRIDETVTLHECEIAGLRFTNAEVVSFDDTTDTAILRMISESSDEIENKKITVSVNSILSGEAQTDAINIGYTVGEIAGQIENPALVSKPSIEGFCISGPDYHGYEKRLDNNDLAVLKAWQTPIVPQEADWVQINAVGYFNNELHIQTAPTSELGSINRIAFGLKRSDGSMVDCVTMEVYLGRDPLLNTVAEYKEATEHVLVIPEGENLDDLIIYVWTQTYASLTKANWSTTFQLKKPDQELRFDCVMDMQPWQTQQVVVSPIGVRVIGHGEMQANSRSADVAVYLKDGTKVTSNRSSVFVTAPDEILCRDTFTELIDLDEVEEVYLNGKRLM